MGLLDAILGRSKPPKADLDVLFAVPQAAISLQAAGFTPNGLGSVCFRDVEGGADDAVMDEVHKLIATDGTSTVARSEDGFGFRWLTVTRTDADVSGLVADLHAANSSLVDAGFGTSLLCSTIGFATADGKPFALVYLFKQGSFYPFAPIGDNRRDNALELQIRGTVAGDVPIEADLSKWLAIWGAPGLS